MSASESPVAGQPVMETRYPTTPWAAARLYRSFVLAAIVFGTTGTAFGAMFLTLPGATPALVQVHGALQLLGWCGLFVIGVAMHVVPRFQGNVPVAFPAPQRAMLVLIAGGLLLRAVAQPWVSVPGRPLLLAAAGCAVGAGLALFVTTLVPVVRRGTATRRPVDHWFWLGLAGATATAVTYAAASVLLAGRDASMVEATWNTAVHRLALYSFILPFAFGISSRAVSGFLSLRARHDRLDRLALGLLVAGIAIHLAAAGTSASALHDWEQGILGVALITFTASLRIFEPRRRAAPEPRERPARWFYWYVLTAYSWLTVAALLMLLPALRAAGVRVTPPELLAFHAVSVGFLTVLIIGLGARILPLFEGRPLPLPALLAPACVGLVTGTAIRVAGAFIPLPTEAIGAAGVLTAAGFLCGVTPLAILLMQRPSRMEPPLHDSEG